MSSADWYDPQTGRFLSQDPIGLAGGVNLYAYAGNNPASYSDPFGLCPPDDKNTADCPNTDLGDGWRKLDESKAGRKVIKQYVKSKPTVDTDISTCQAANCTDPDRKGVHVSGNAAATAIGLSHEIVHVRGKRTAGTGDYVFKEEIPAWKSAFGVYDQMSPADQAASGYTDRRELWRTPNGRVSFINQIICQTVTPRPSACP